MREVNRGYLELNKPVMRQCHEFTEGMMMRARRRSAEKISTDQFDCLKLRILEAADRLTDDQILDVADVLHQVLRQRSRAHFRLSRKLAQSPLRQVN